MSKVTTPMNAFFNIGNITNFILILLSVAASGWCIFRLKKGGKRRKLYYAGIVLSLLMIVLCIRGSYHIFQYCDFYNKILRPTSSFYLDELSLSPEECREDFDEITDIVQGNYAPIARHKGIDLKELNKKYKEEMKAVKNAEQYGLLLLRYFSDLQNMHTFIFASEYKSGVSVGSRNDSVWIVHCPNKNINLQQKDLILAVNRIPTAEYIKRQMGITPASTDNARRETAALNILSSYTDSCKLVTVQRNDSVFSVSLPLYKQKEIATRLGKVNHKDSLTARDISVQTVATWVNMFKGLDDVGFIHIKNFKQGSVETFCRHIKGEFKCPYLILDLQSNPGGTKQNVIDIAPYLISRTTTIGNLTIESNSAKCYKGKLFVLIDNFTSSGAETLAAILKGQPNTLLIGHRTAGDCGSRGYNFKTSHGIEFKLATQPPYLLPDGVTWSEGQGIAPDIKVKESLPWEEETVFNIAINLITKDKQKNAYEFK